MLRFLISIILLLNFVPCLFAAENDGMDFAVSRTTTGSWEKSRHHLANDWVSHLPEDNKKLEYLAVSYTLTNNNENRKLDLTEGFEFSLQDEFGNIYRRIKKPAGYSEPVMLVAKNFPSLYPGETYGETLFFEAPLAKASRLSLIIDATSIGIKDKVALPVDRNTRPDKNLLPARPQKAQEPEIPLPSGNISSHPVIPGEGCPLDITAPENGTTLEAGRFVRIQLNVEPEQIPDHIRITGPGFSAGHQAPKARNTYDFTIPAEHPPGIYAISASAEWRDTSTRPSECSDSIFVYINNPSISSETQKR